MLAHFAGGGGGVRNRILGYYRIVKLILNQNEHNFRFLGGEILDIPSLDIWFRRLGSISILHLELS